MGRSDDTVLITGGASGIGRATAELFVERGSDVVIADVDEAAATEFLEQTDANSLKFVETDVTSVEDVETLVETTIAEFGTVDLLVNSAGSTQTPEPISRQSVQEWDRVMDVHVRGTYLCSKFALEEMLRSESGSIVNISSIASFAAFPYRTAYNTAKSAINMLTKTLAIEAAASEVRVNAVAPGYVLTPLIEPLVESGEHDVSEINERTPMGRLADPLEIAETIEFLSSDRASYITGAIIPVDGGWTAFTGYGTF